MEPVQFPSSFSAVDKPAILIIDDDAGTRDTFRWSLSRQSGFRVETAATGTDGLCLARADRFDVLLIDLKLPDMSGIEILRILNKQPCHARLILMSAFADVPTTVEAMKLGAFTVLEKPLDVDELELAARSALADAEPPKVDASKPLRSRSVAGRLAGHIIKVCDSDGDLKTLNDWARFAGVSYSTLREMCRLAEVKPHAARDFARVLRCVIRSRIEGCPPEVLLDVSDRRTLETLLRKGGLEDRRGSISVESYLLSQRFIPHGNVTLRIVRRLLSESM